MKNQNKYLIIVFSFFVWLQEIEAKIISYKFNDRVYSFVHDEPLKVHVDEWKQSAIADDIIELNLLSLPCQLDTGLGIRYPYFDLLELPYSFARQEFSLDENFCQDRVIWAQSGYDPISLEKSSFYAVKPVPSVRKEVKYEHNFLKRKIRLARVSNRVAQIVFPDLYKGLQDHELNKEAQNFWQQVYDSNIPIVFTEGAKKAYSLLSYGIVAISLDGICSVFLHSDENKLILNPEIKHILNQSPREFYISFDNDIKTKSTDNVFSSLVYSVQMIKDYGKEIRIIHIPDPSTKGADDFIYKHGITEFKKLIDNAYTLENFKNKFAYYDLNSAYQKFLDTKGQYFDWCFYRCEAPCLQKNYCSKVRDDYPKVEFKECSKAKNQFKTPYKSWLFQNDDLKFYNFGRGIISYVYKEPLPEHIKVWQKSAISNDLIDLNLISLPDIVVDENNQFVTYPMFDAIDVDTKKLSEHYSIPLNKPQRTIWTYKSYDLEKLMTNDNYEFRLSKPIRPYQRYEYNKDDAIIRLPLIPNRIAQKIFPEEYKDISKNDMSKEALNFWSQVFDSDKEIYLTEGHKKALSLLSNGLVAIGVQNLCFGFYVKEGELRINSDLERLLRIKKRKYIIVFDNETSLYLSKILNSATFFLAKNIKQFGSEVSILSLKKSGYKAVDDYIYSKGFDSFVKEVLANEITFEEYQNRNSNVEELEVLFEKFKEDNSRYHWCFKPCKGKCIADF